MLGNSDLLSHLQAHYPREVHRVGQLIDPRECEHAGYEEALRERGKRPWVIFDQSLRADGEKWRGLFSTCNFNSFSLMALSYGLDLKKSRPFDLILKHHHGMTHPVAPRWIEKKQAPVKQVVQRGDRRQFRDAADIQELR